MGGFVDTIRSFNRFYTRQIGILGKAYLDSGLSLTEVRVLYELAHRDGMPAVDLARDLAIDTGYLSRILAGFRKKGLIGRRAAEGDGRESRVFLTAKGRRSIESLEKRARVQIETMTEHLSSDQRAALTSSMRTVETLLGGSARPSTYLLRRSHRPGDIGYVVHRHGVLYAKEYGYDETFEALVAEIAAKFIQKLDQQRERCWIAERDGSIAGCVFLVKHEEHVAKLRLLLVEPSARGLGLGSRLVEECIRFAREKKYEKLVLWTQSELIAARAIYQKAGFQRTAEEPHHSFGKDLVAETWELEL
jgi:DNA-binding MarR family transcriptional regulator/N-acetylglutamate synthase-like GNAT family acetyltransferase